MIKSFEISILTTRKAIHLDWNELNSIKLKQKNKKETYVELGYSRKPYWFLIPYLGLQNDCMIGMKPALGKGHASKCDTSTGRACCFTLIATMIRKSTSGTVSSNANTTIDLFLMRKFFHKRRLNWWKYFFIVFLYLSLSFRIRTFILKLDFIFFFFFFVFYPIILPLLFFFCSILLLISLLLVCFKNSTIKNTKIFKTKIKQRLLYI